MPDATEVIQAEPEEDFTLFQEVLHGAHLYGTEEQYPDRGGGTSGEARIQRASDENYWTGSAWQAAEIWLNTAVHSTGLKHSITLPGTEVVEGEEFFFTIGLPNENLSRVLVNVIAGGVSGGGGGGGSGNRLVVPPVLIRPVSGTNTYLVELKVRGDDGLLVNADATPVIALEDSGGAAPSGISLGTLSNPDSGCYQGILSVEDSTNESGIVYRATFDVDSESKVVLESSTVMMEGQGADQTPGARFD